jgi:autotransporter-associated beta strand protein
LLLLLVASLSTLSAQAVTIYQDDFSGDGLSSLNGAAPDVAPAAETWASGSHLLNNGVQDGAGRFTALLPFTPTTPGLYTLSADFSVTGSSNQWMAVGFAEALAPGSTGLEERWLDGSNNSRPALWALSRTTGSPGTDTSFLGYAGGNHTFGGVASSTTSATSMIITIDTSAADWNVTWDFNGDGVDRTETVLAADVPNINYVGFSSTDAAGTATITSFLLDGPAPPANSWNVDGGGSFNTAGNWLANVVPTTDAIFGSVLTTPNAPASVTLDSAVSLTEVSFQNPNTYALEGPSTLTLTGSATLNATQGTHLINAQVAGSNGLTKTGGGTIVLSNNTNSYTGDTTVSGGTLRITQLGAINPSSGSINIGASGTFALAGDGAGNGVNGTLTGAITGAGSLVAEPTLTTEVVTLAGANPGYAGEVVINGGTLRVSHPGGLGTGDGTQATGVTVTGGPQLDTGVLELASVNISGERLQLTGRQPGQTAPALTSTGTSQWGGPIAGVAGGNQYNLESQPGSLLTLTGDITLPDTAVGGDLAVPSTGGRYLNLSGAGNGRIEGQIIDRTLVEGDDAENANINVVKTGSGRWTIATTPPPQNPPTSTARDGYHQGRTVIAEGTLAVEAKGAGSNEGELFSRTIEVASGATFDISSFTTYNLQTIDDPDEMLSTGDETGQILSGAGQVSVGGTLGSFDDSSLSPGDTVGNAAVANGTGAVGTLSLVGNYSHSTFTSTPAGSWNFDLGDTTAAGDSDRLVVSGSTTINAAASADKIQVNITPAEGSLAGGTYALVQSGGLSFAGSAGNSTYNASIVDQNGIDITADSFQTVSVSHSGSNIVATVSPGRNLAWAGNVNSQWDVKSTNNWTGSGTQFGQLDKVTFGNVANKNVNVDVPVLPGSTTFNGGAASTYTVTGSGGLNGTGPVNVDSGTVRLQNTGNSYSGPTSVASGARLEINSAATGSMVVNGTLSVGGAGVVSGGAQTFFADDFDGAGGTLNGTTPDTSFSGARWVAAATFEDDGDSIAGTGGGSATLAFTPIDGSTYTLQTSLSSITGDNDWFALGFASGQSTANSGNSRFITGNVEGLAWALYRGDSSASANQTFLGNLSVEPNSGLASGSPWLVDTNTGGGSVDLRITLDTTGGAGNWTATMEADTGSGFQVIRATEAMLDEAINSVGIANSNTADLTGTINSFSLTGVEPPGSRLNGQTLTVQGDLTMSASSTLELDIALFGQDFLDVTGAATLAGTIDVTKLGSFTPDTGSQYTLLSAAEGITDLGVSYNLPAGSFASIVDTTDLVLTFGSPSDADGDGRVTGADFLILQRTNPGALPQWEADFGTGGTGQAATGAVPEPNTAMLVICAGIALAAGRSKRLTR